MNAAISPIQANKLSTYCEATFDPPPKHLSRWFVIIHLIYLATKLSNGAPPDMINADKVSIEISIRPRYNLVFKISENGERRSHEIWDEETLILCCLFLLYDIKR
ncbi:hypothetical protein E3N88_36607 [Mikania micrantha]|uniref:Uncharacterized protein n=1 Tax=Mikania micrantha TaxID=192012 RepID=A0A5N6M4D1_9ASTR|nr:hypothetical protein E3N88_36607 [Mikania micrantha]